MPHVILLPGFLGMHLTDQDGTRLWLDPPTIAARADIAERLALDPSTGCDAFPGASVAPTGVIGFIYDGLVRALEKEEGFQVHVFLFDFRKSLLRTAQALRAFVAAEVVPKLAPGDRIWFVGHSIGGPLAALYPYTDPLADPPQIDPGWPGPIAGAIFHGGTLLGTLEPVDAITGSHWFLSVVGMGDKTREDALRRSASTWPGLMSILPDPETFEGIDDVYVADRWPEGFRPAQAHLDEAKGIKRLARESPLFDLPVTQILAGDYHTPATIAEGGSGIALGPRTAPGDDTVPLFASAPKRAVRLLRTRFSHTFAPADPGVVQATIDLVRRGATDVLPPLDPAAPQEMLPGPPLPPPIAMLLGMGDGALDDLSHGSRVIRILAHMLGG